MFTFFYVMFSGLVLLIYVPKLNAKQDSESSGQSLEDVWGNNES